MQPALLPVPLQPGLVLKRFRQVPLADLEMVLPGAAVSLPPNLYLSLAFTLAAGLVAAALAVMQVGRALKQPTRGSHSSHWLGILPRLWRNLHLPSPSLMQGAWGVQLARALATILLSRHGGRLGILRLIATSTSAGCHRLAFMQPGAATCSAASQPGSWLACLSLLARAGHTRFTSTLPMSAPPS